MQKSNHFPKYQSFFGENFIIQVSGLYFLGGAFGIGPDAMYSVRHNAAWLNTLANKLPKSET
jgi:hypothetical protein